MSRFKADPAIIEFIRDDTDLKEKHENNQKHPK